MIELETLGTPSIRRDGEELHDLAGHKQKVALLSYLAIEGPVSRENLVTLFWPDNTEQKARQLLSSSLYLVKKAVGENVIRVVGDSVELEPAKVHTDVDALVGANEAHRWGEIVRLYRGPFLQGFYLPDARGFEEWQSRTRAWIGSIARRAFAHAVATHVEQADPKGALDIAGDWAGAEPLEDEAQHALIALLAMSGDRSGALAQFEAYSARLSAELQLQPLEPTVALVEAIRAGRLPSSPLLGEDVSFEAAAAAEAEAEDVELRVDEAGPVVADIDDLVREELGPRLKIVRKLSEGAHSRVYLAREPALKRDVAVKVFSPRLASDRRARLRFEREVLAVASLSHPNIAGLHWADSLSNGLPYFVMEYVAGPPMAEKLRLQGRFSSEQARKILTQLASALAAAHRRGIVHRDVQLSNVLCDEESGRCLLTDFGIAGILSQADIQAIRITQSNELVGDPAWMSPEQLQAKEVTERSDVYSLGLVGYQLLTEQSPYMASSRQELFQAKVNEPPRKLSELEPDADPSLARLLERCLAREPRRRPSAAQLARELRESPDSEEREPPGFFARLVYRRVVHWLAAYLTGGYGLFVELPQILSERYDWSDTPFDVALTSYVLGAPAVFVLAWYHGRAGRQAFKNLELWLLGAVVLIWLTVLVFVVLS